jgi:thiol-disulfide isomerase/thioredoxin
MKRTTTLIALFTAASLAGCGKAAQSQDDAGTCTTSSTYPCAPYGFGPPNVIADVRLNGHNDDMTGMPSEMPHDINFHDYYQNKSLKVLVVLVAADWCGPCKTEQPSLITLYNGYQTSNPGQVAFVESITQDNNSNVATISDVDIWAKTYHDPFTMAADPDNTLSQYLGTMTFPGQMVIKTSDMSIQWKNNGLAGDMLKTQVDTVLSGS